MADSDSKQIAEANLSPQMDQPAAILLRLRRPLIVLAHIMAFAMSLFLAFLLANDMRLLTDSNWLLGQYPRLLLYTIVIKLLIFGLFKQYRGWWRYVGISDLVSIAVASLVSTFVIVSLWVTMLNTSTAIRRSWFLMNMDAVSQGVFMADMFATILFLGGLRMAIRLYHEEFRTVESGRLKRFLIIGAGNAGEALLREIHRMSVTQYEVIGFIDDDQAKTGISIHGIPVLGTVEELPEICESRNIEEIAIAMPAATHQQLRRVVQVCQGTKIR
ncbi:MAG: nucleoside-diphosphate sugar epimerase/dehydratase, partial [Planctomycetota bacterium]